MYFVMQCKIHRHFKIQTHLIYIYSAIDIESVKHPIFQYLFKKKKGKERNLRVREKMFLFLRLLGLLNFFLRLLDFEIDLLPSDGNIAFEHFQSFISEILF